MSKMCHTRTGGTVCVVLVGLLATCGLVLMTACHSSEEPVESALESPLEPPSDDRRREAHALSEGGSVLNAPLENEEDEEAISDGGIEAQGIGDGGIEAQGIGDGGIGVGSEPEG